MYAKKETANVKSVTRSPKRRKNLDDVTLSGSVGRTQSLSLTTTTTTTGSTIRKIERSQTLKNDEAAVQNSKKLEIKEQNSSLRTTSNRQNLLLRNNNDIRTVQRSKAIEDNARLTAKKRPVRSVSQRTLKSTEQTKLIDKQKSTKCSNVKPASIEEKEENSNKISTRKENEAHEKRKFQDEALDPSKLTLAERIKMFNEKIATEKAIESKNNLLYGGKKMTGKHWLASRSRTQPVTSEELEAAYQKPVSHYQYRHSMFERGRGKLSLMFNFVNMIHRSDNTVY